MTFTYLNFKAAAISVAAASLMATAANAQTVGIGTTAPGSFTHSSGSAMAKVIAEKAGLKARVQPGSGTAHRRIVAGDVQFGLGNAWDTTFFVAGSHMYEGNGPKKNLRIAAVMTPLRVGIFVRKDSPIQSIKGLKGKNVPGGFTVQKAIKQIITAHLANAGLTYKDVKMNPAPNVVRAAGDFAKGKNDMLFFAIGSAKVLQVSAKVGGIRGLSIDDSPAAVARMQKILPGSYPMTVKPSKRNHGILKPTKIIGFDFLLNTAAEVPADVVYKVVKALHGNKKGLLASFKGLGGFKPKRMAKKYAGLQYHAGAIKFYKEIGQWPPK
ncbi:MAG: TAXI family TRAP transporter solute-binding subunit [Rhodospirillaceae bacterium]|nr:TAXI family TRAP transporter solute-binding subunit [Rhodospirillaceae bacterium]